MPYVPALRPAQFGLATQAEAIAALAADDLRPAHTQTGDLRQDRQELNLGRWCDDRGIGGEQLTYKGDRHGLVFGPTGCGKTTRWLMTNLLGDNLLDASVIVTDPKGELAAVTAPFRIEQGHDVKIIDPFGKLAELVAADPKKYARLLKAGVVESVGFNPMMLLRRDNPLFYDDAAALSEALIEVEDRDPHWARSAQGLLTGLIMLEKANNGQEASLINVRKMLTAPIAYKDLVDAEGNVTHKNAPVSGLPATAVRAVEMAEKMAEKGKSGIYSIDIIADLLSKFIGDKKDGISREMQSVMSTADAQTRWLLSPMMQVDLQKPGFDFANLKKRKTTVYLIIPAERIRTYSGWIRMLIVSALRSLYSSGGKRTVFLLDEMPAFGNLPPLADAFGVIRGFNMQIIGIAQDLVQLKDLYKDRYESFLANTGFAQFFAPNDMMTAGWVSKRAGDHPVAVYGVNATTTPMEGYEEKRSEGESVSQQWMPIFRPQDLMGFPVGTGLLFYAGMSYPIRFLAPRFDQYRSNAVRASPAPY